METKAVTDKVPNQKLDELAAREEVLILSLMLKDENLIKDAVKSGITADFFQNEIPKAIYAMAQRYYEEYGARLTRQSIELTLAKTKTPEEAAFVQSQYDSIYAEYLRPSDGQYPEFKKSLNGRYIQRQARAACLDYADKLLGSLDGQENIVSDLSVTISKIKGVTKDGDFPRIVCAADFVAQEHPEPPQLITGVLHKGSKGVYGGPSKAFKSWTLIDMSMSVASGADWLGFKTQPGRVLYINLELQDFAVHGRVKAIANDRLMDVPRNLDIWNLRGHVKPIKHLMDELRRQVKGEGYSLICPDPIYKTLAGMDENSAGDIASICNEIEMMAYETGAAIVFGAHYAKGNAANKEAIDRISGSGVWARDPDTIITATTHEIEKSFSIEMTLRNFAQQDPFVVTWNYPRMTRDDTLDPKALKQAKNGRQATNKVQDILEHLGSGKSTSDWQKTCLEETGMPRTTFYRLYNEARDKQLVHREGKLWIPTSACQQLPCTTDNDGGF